ncbi:uncharacterized protein LOC118437008 [Folsomia candida]|uniref:uncharacterized protein LOC118437008 n=1 Tax=Folsomia candida TaxID=158441 RepID=UPI001604F04A|nr:uncharacterized protein LOC118437008 [Folsomia candida]
MLPLNRSSRVFAGLITVALIGSCGAKLRHNEPRCDQPCRNGGDGINQCCQQIGYDDGGVCMYPNNIRSEGYARCYTNGNTVPNCIGPDQKCGSYANNAQCCPGYTCFCENDMSGKMWSICSCRQRYG